jgi:hypothetical protein
MLVVVVFVSSPSITLLALTILYGVSGPFHLVVRHFRGGARRVAPDQRLATTKPQAKSGA